MFDAGFHYSGKFKCYFKYASQDILQIFSNKICSNRNVWEANVGIYPLCEPNDIEISNPLSWYNFYFKSFPWRMGISFWNPAIKENLREILLDEYNMTMDQRLQDCSLLLKEYILPKLCCITSLSSYMVFVEEMPQYIATSETMAPLYGRYGMLSAIDTEIMKFHERIRENNPIITKWNLNLIQQYTTVRNQLLQKGPESFESLLFQYAKATRARLDAEMVGPLPVFKRI